MPRVLWETGTPPRFGEGLGERLTATGAPSDNEIARIAQPTLSQQPAGSAAAPAETAEEERPVLLLDSTFAAASDIVGGAAFWETLHE
jgi:hypothetical protein